MEPVQVEELQAFLSQLFVTYVFPFDLLLATVVKIVELFRRLVTCRQIKLSLFTPENHDGVARSDCNQSDYPNSEGEVTIRSQYGNKDRGVSESEVVKQTHFDVPFC